VWSSSGRRYRNGYRWAADISNSLWKALYDQEFDAAFVFMEYSYFRRNPDQEGYDFWLDKLRRYGNWVDAQMGPGIHHLAVIQEPVRSTLIERFSKRYRMRRQFCERLSANVRRVVICSGCR